jgi:hypothetical protein
MPQPTGKKRFLRLRQSKSEFPLRNTVEVHEGLEIGPLEPSKTTIVDHNDNNFTVVFMKKCIDKKEFKRRLNDMLEGPQKVGKKLAKKLILDEMLADAPVKETRAEIFVEGDFVYICGSHKRVAETLFPASLELTDGVEHITKLWLMSGEPCNNVTIQEFSLGWTRNFKADSKPAAQAACDEGGQVVKFTDVISYSICADRLVVAGEFTSLEQVDEVYTQALERNQEA